MPDTPIRVRRAARWLLLDPEERLLLLRAPTHDGRTIWFTPGGGLEADESYADAAVRELYEETGLTVSIGEVGTPVWRHRFAVGPGSPAFADATHGLEVFFLRRVDAPFEPRPTYIDAFEDYMRQDGWWAWLSLDAIARLDPVLHSAGPRALASLLPAVLAGELAATLEIESAF